MNDFWRDPQLNELVREINRSEAAGPAVPQLRFAALPADAGESLRILLEAVNQRNATDLLLIPGLRPVLRIHGEIVLLGDNEISAEEISQMFAPWFDTKRTGEVSSSGSTDFAIRHSHRRFRINIHRQRGELAAAVRSLPAEIPTLDQLGLPGTLSKLIEPAAGLVLVCGPTGAGKSSTLAALVGEINRRFARHVVTIEDPIEYEHASARSVIEQIEIGVDAPSFAAALRSTLRQDPDVILVGEMRDLETIATALTAAETGHLILATLHTSDATQAIHRIVDVFPTGQQSQIRHQLAMSLNAIVSQQLLRALRPPRSRSCCGAAAGQ